MENIWKKLAAGDTIFCMLGGGAPHCGFIADNARNNPRETIVCFACAGSRSSTVHAKKVVAAKDIKSP
jgi:hypothetical protein